MSRIRIAVFLAVACGLLAVPAAVAKDFGPGDLRVCGRHHCVSITNRHLVQILRDFYWGPRRVQRAERVRLGAPGFELRWKDGYASGMVAGAMLKRFRAYGFYCERFERGKWYWFSPRAAAALRRMTAGLRPLRVSTPPPSC